MARSSQLEARAWCGRIRSAYQNVGISFNIYMQRECVKLTGVSDVAERC